MRARVYIFRFVYWGGYVRTRAISEDAMEHVLALLTRPNELVCRVCLAAALRVGDALNIKARQLRQQRFTLIEEKTGKRRIVELPAALRADVLEYSGKVYAFPSRCDPLRHRTRQAVWKDIKRAQRALRLKGLGTHSMRKSAAVRKYKACGDMRKVKQLLNHSSEVVTALYALAEVSELRQQPGSRGAAGKREPQASQ